MRQIAPSFKAMMTFNAFRPARIFRVSPIAGI